MAKGLTEKQQQILDYIQRYVRTEGFPPSIREIGKDFNIGSLRGVTVHLDALSRKGYISRSNTPRSIKVVHPDVKARTDMHVAMLKLLGSIAAGVPLAAQQHVEDVIPVPIGMIRGAADAYLLRVNGESMIDAGILDRDLVIIKPQQSAIQNDIVAAMIDGETTVKVLDFSLADCPRLLPRNSSFAPILLPPDVPVILGKVIGLLRDYDRRAF